MDWQLAGKVATVLGAVALAWWIIYEARHPMRQCDSCERLVERLTHYLDASVCNHCHEARQRGKR